MYSDARPLLPVNAPFVKPAANPGARVAQYCQVCGLIGGVVVLNLLWVLLRVGTATCAVESFKSDLILPANAQAAGVPEPFDRGTAANMDLSALDIDLAGTWWMDGNPLVAEHLVSFAGAQGQLPFPALVPVPNNLQRRWTWSDNFYGRLVQATYAFEALPRTPLEFRFMNNSYAHIKPISSVFVGNFGFKKINEDEWDRADSGYVLRRVVNADGTEGPFYQKFLAWYARNVRSEEIIVWSSDSACLRRCQYYFLCAMCDRICR